MSFFFLVVIFLDEIHRMVRTSNL